MINHTAVVILLLLSPLALAGGNGDAVNERIPVTGAELEAHWQVNCTGAWERLRAAVARDSAADKCGITPDLAREIRLCGFIYQAPGESTRHGCPDYRGIAQQLERGGKTARCTGLRATIRQKLDCRAGFN